MTRPRVARFLVLALASGLFATEYPGAWLLTMLGLAALAAALTTGSRRQRARRVVALRRVFRLPRWAFRSLRLQRTAPPAAPTLARAWWAAPGG